MPLCPSIPIHNFFIPASAARLPDSAARPQPPAPPALTPHPRLHPIHTSFIHTCQCSQAPRFCRGTHCRLQPLQLPPQLADGCLIRALLLIRCFLHLTLDRIGTLRYKRGGQGGRYVRGGGGVNSGTRDDTCEETSAGRYVYQTPPTPACLQSEPPVQPALTPILQPWRHARAPPRQPWLGTEQSERGMWANRAR